MPLYEPWLTTRNHVKTHRELSATDTDLDAFIDDQIREVSAEFVQAIGRVPVPYLHTQAYDARGDHLGLYHLDVKDLLAITTLTNGDGTTIASSAYVLESPGYTPYWRVRLKQSAGVVFTEGTDWEQAISIAGTFGDVPHYGQNAITDSGINLHTGGISSSATTHALNTGQGASFEVGQYIRLESEWLQITAISTDTLTLARAQWGTTAVAHNAGIDIYTFNQLWDIRKAVREVVVYKFLNKDQIGGRIRVFDQTGSVIVQDLDPSVQRTIEKHTYGRFRIGVA